MQCADMCLLVRTHQEQYQRKQDSHFDRYRQVEDHRQEERDQQHPQVAVRMFDQTGNGLPTAHRVCHHDQYSRQTTHGNHTHQLSHEQQYQQQYHGMDNTRHGRTTAVVDVRHRTGDSTGCRDSAEERHYHVRHTLRDQLRVRVMAVADHTVRHHRTQQRLYRA